MHMSSQGVPTDVFFPVKRFAVSVSASGERYLCTLFHPLGESHGRLCKKAVECLQLAAEWDAGSGLHRASKGACLMAFKREICCVLQRTNGWIYGGAHPVTFHPSLLRRFWKMFWLNEAKLFHLLQSRLYCCILFHATHWDDTAAKTAAPNNQTSRFQALAFSAVNVVGTHNLPLLTTGQFWDLPLSA
jgi:hypothetical protein